MREIYVRGMSGGLYATLIVIALFNNQITFSIVLVVFSTLALIEFQRLINYKSYFAITLLLLLVYNFYKSHIDHSALIYLLIPNFTTHFFLFYKLFKSKKIKFKYITKSILSSLYLALGCFFIIALAGTAENYNPMEVLLFFILVWVNNSFAYLIGKKIGKRPLFKSISPKKTWEGFLGGLLFTVIAAVIIYYYKGDFSLNFYIVYAILIPVFATLGDLIQSKFKRHANVKDSGSLIPGHGGFFDRMDSVIFSAPWIYFIIKLNQYVS
jgi:phosphatidate cytidylyltransferase